MLCLTPDQVAEMIEHAQAEAPLEACGLLAGPPGRVERVYRTTNAARSPIAYRLDPQEQYDLFMDIEERGWEMVGIYHSHPGLSAYPSLTDVEQAFYPEAVYVVVSLAGTEPVVRAFRIVDGVITEEELCIV